MNKLALTILKLGIPAGIFSMLVAMIFAEKSDTLPITTSFITGFFIGLVLALVTKFNGADWASAQMKNVSINVEEDEKIINEDGACHYKGIEAVGGKLVLTDKRLIFKSN